MYLNFSFSHSTKPLPQSFYNKNNNNNNFYNNTKNKNNN